MRADELVPRRCLFSLRRGRYTVALQYVADGLVARSIPEVRHGPGNAIIAPRSVLSREADNQLFDLFVDSWSPRIRPVLGTVELPCDELAVPVWSKYSNAQRVSSLHLSKGRLNPPLRSDTYSSSAAVRTPGGPVARHPQPRGRKPALRREIPSILRGFQGRLSC